MPLDTTFLSLLRSPDDKSPLTQINETQLQSTKEQIPYPIEQGIPLLYGKQVDMDHLHEEEQLASMMTNEERSHTEALSLGEWKKSKEEFWNIVHTTIDAKATPQKILYIGCGYDTRAHEFTSQGHMFVNIDLIKEMVFEQQRVSKNNTNVVGDINALPFATDSFDAIICIDVIHHEYYSLSPLLAHITSFLKKDGVLFLADPNAWAVFQIPKTLLLPKPLYKKVRSLYHQIKKSSHKPAEYEFPTTIATIRRILRTQGITNIQVHPMYSYPEKGRVGVALYRLLARSKYIATYHNYHYCLVAKK